MAAIDSLRLIPLVVPEWDSHEEVKHYQEVKEQDWKYRIPSFLSNDPSYFRNISIKDIGLTAEYANKGEIKLTIHGNTLTEIKGPPCLVERFTIRLPKMTSDGLEYDIGGFEVRIRRGDQLENIAVGTEYADLKDEQTSFFAFLAELRKKTIIMIYYMPSVAIDRKKLFKKEIKFSRHLIERHLTPETFRLELDKLVVARFMDEATTIGGPHLSGISLRWKTTRKRCPEDFPPGLDAPEFMRDLYRLGRIYVYPPILDRDGGRVVMMMQDSIPLKKNHFYIPEIDPIVFCTNSGDTRGYGLALYYKSLRMTDGNSNLTFDDLKRKFESKKAQNAGLKRKLEYADLKIARGKAKTLKLRKDIEIMQEAQESISEVQEMMQKEIAEAQKLNLALCDDISRFEDQGDFRCKICKEHALTTVLYPCKHLGFCRLCADDLIARNQKCPFCRRNILWCDSLYVQ